jgi:hypothetical protein
VGFGALGRAFFGTMASKMLNYFLSKTLGTQVGEGRRFATLKECSEFKGALAKHCGEAAVIVENSDTRRRPRNQGHDGAKGKNQNLSNDAARPVTEQARG